MNLISRSIIAEITDADFDPNYVPPKKLEGMRIRKSSRGIVVNSENKLALLFVSKENYHKLPGGGIESGENNQQAFVREVLEETGCNCQILNDKNQNSLVMETRGLRKLLQFSYIFYSQAIGQPGEIHLQPDEIAEGLQLKWVTFDQASKLLQSDQPQNYEGKFIQKRDLSVLNFYK